MEDRFEVFKLKARLCRSFADPHRLVVIQELRTGEKTVSEIQRALNIPQASVSRHLAILRENGVVVAKRKGVNVFYGLSDTRIGDVCDILQEILIRRIEKDQKVAKRLYRKNKET